MDKIEHRNRLTAVQVKHLVETQDALRKARQQLQEAEAASTQVLALIFDAAGVPAHVQATFDDTTNELVYYLDPPQPSAQEGSSTRPRPAAKK